MTGEKKKEIWRVVKFVLFSASAGIIQIGLFTLLNELCKWSYWPCYLIALVASVVWNFTPLRSFSSQVLSSSAFQVSANPGISSILALRLISDSKMCAEKESFVVTLW